MPYFESLKNAKGIVDVFMNRPSKYSVALTLAQEILREESHLSPLDRELIAAYTSYLNNCSYCHGSHKEFCISLGATQEDLEIFSDEHNHRLSPILKFVKVLTISPSFVNQELKDEVINAGFTEEELKDAIAVCAAFNFYNRIVEGHGIEENANTWKQAADMINRFGYDRRYTNSYDTYIENMGGKGLS